VLCHTALGVAERMAVVRNLSGVSQEGNVEGWKLNATVVICILKSILIYLLPEAGLTPGGGSTVHSYTQTVQRTTQLIWEECGLCPVFASSTVSFALQLRKKHG
jgi:hypothetical protein